MYLSICQIHITKFIHLYIFVIQIVIKIKVLMNFNNIQSISWHKVYFYSAPRIFHTFILFGSFFILSSSSFASEESKFIDGEYHTVKAKPGDGLATFMQRYKMTSENGMKQAFYNLNNLSKNSNLFLHKNYVLPIHLYNYNGKSIRSTIGIDDWEKAVRIKEYNEDLHNRGVRLTHFTKSKILWVPSPELADNPPSTAVPEKNNPITPNPKPVVLKSSVSDDIFGKKYATIDIIDQELQGKVFYIVSGHGGPDPGAECLDCSSRLCEDEYAYDVSLRLARILKEHGAKVEIVVTDPNDGIRDQSILKCDKDERMADNARLPINQLKRLQQRTDYINSKWKYHKQQGLYDQYVVSIHIDSNNASHKQDVFFCYAKGSNVSRSLATSLRNKFSDKYKQHQKNRNYKGFLQERGLFVLRRTAPPAVLVELANIRNRNNHKRILLKENRQALANWLYEGLAEHALKNSSSRGLASAQ